MIIHDAILHFYIIGVGISKPLPPVHGKFVPTLEPHQKPSVSLEYAGEEVMLLRNHGPNFAKVFMPMFFMEDIYIRSGEGLVIWTFGEMRRRPKASSKLLLRHFTQIQRTLEIYVVPASFFDDPDAESFDGLQYVPEYAI